MMRFRFPRLKKTQIIVIPFLILMIIWARHLNLQTIVINNDSDPCSSKDGSELMKKIELRTLRTVEDQYKTKLKNLSKTELSEVTNYYHRDVSLHWDSSHTLLPQSKPVPDKTCLRHLDQTFTTSVSVVMCMKNELIYLLLRTLTTLVKRTPPHLLREILLIDDGSDTDSSSEITDFSLKMGIPIKIQRNNVSVGITNCRNSAIRQAEGEVVVILDTHMEVSDIWLEPLLDILQEKPSAVAVPTLDLINEKDYDAKHLRVVNAYGIEMMSGYSFFRYYKTGPPQHHQSEPYQSASILGGALAAYKATFLEFYPQGVLGEYWGTENSRLALRMWMCGDGLWMTRCSQVLHNNGNDGGLQRYLKDSPDMWLHLHYETLGDVVNFIREEDDKRRMLRSVYREEEHVEKVLSVSRTIQEQFKSTCSRDYAWYLKNVQPPESMHYVRMSSSDYYHLIGEAESVSHPNYCIITDYNKAYVDQKCRKDMTLVYDTHLLGFSVTGEVQTTVQTLNCWDCGQGANNETAIGMYGCHSVANPDLETTYTTQNFQYDVDTKQIRHVESKRCVQIFPDDKKILLVYCTGRPEQKWIINLPRWYTKH
ncbi:probable N-acetylgalactosaminyltransferase 8 [Bolinopsis microptera]|uniref:probable N-acetylgalactosaminyltransferase 8 n=1 Tax=Bolinopsis microptera TaxID=2820187 RepID=UPI0030793940